MRAPRRHQTSGAAQPAAAKGKTPDPKAAKKTALPNLRLLPVTIFVAVLMLSVRINDVWKGFSSLGSATIEVNQSGAQQPPPPGGRKPGQRTPTAAEGAAPAKSSRPPPPGRRRAPGPPPPPPRGAPRAPASRRPSPRTRSTCCKS